MDKRIKIALYCLLAVLLLVSGYKIIDIVSEYNKASSAYDETADMAVSEVVQSETDIMPPIYVDFDMLCSENNSIIGWIYCEGTVINYPVVQSDDNSYFLRRMPDGTSNKAGSIFMDFRCAPDCSDTNTILYGHNMKNGSMFATLKKYSEQSFYEEHPVMWFLTPDENYRIDIVAGYVTSAGSESFEMFTDREDMQRYLNDSVKKSNFVSGVDVESVESVITLGTCSYEYDAARHVLIGSLVPCGKAEVSSTDA